VTTAVDPGALRTAIGHFATGVAVVTATDRAGRPFGSTANALSSVSLDPPLLLVCLRDVSETLTALLDGGTFAVNLLREGAGDLADRFAGVANDDTWVGVDADHDHGAPILTEALASLRCAVHDTADGGDHTIVIGRVLEVDHPADHQPPLLFYRGAYARLEV
jgi:flavin reductase (DIM6/NTAB) family NADH-FMN oxidoreductase RutF